MSVKPVQKSTPSSLPPQIAHALDVDIRLNNIVDLFKLKREEEAYAQFKKIPEEVQKIIYIRLGEKVCPSSSFWLAAAETGFYFFHNMGNTTPIKHKIEAIFHYLMQQKKDEFASLATHDEQPYEATAIKIEGQNLNAHLVLDGRYILTAHPQAADLPLFWQMVYEYNVPAIVMLNQTHERHCLPYFPQELEETMDYGPYFVTLEKITYIEGFDDAGDICVLFSIKKLLISREGMPSHETTHIHYRLCKDGYPPRQEDMRELLKLVDDHRWKSQGPIVVHCKMGVGRTGTYTAIDYLHPVARDRTPFSLQPIVKQLRSPDSGRHPQMVHTFQQYAFCYHFLWKESKKIP